MSSFYYYILFAILLNTIGFIGLFNQVLTTKDVNSLPYFSLIAFTVSILIFLYISFIRKYPIHLIFYIVTLISLIGILLIKRQNTK
jgi:uncharacterized protein with PQ loop repeat